MTNQEFIETIAPLFQKWAKQYGYKIVSAAIAQACLESAYGTSHKATFGYNGRYKDTLLSLEGLDHTPPLTLFKYPWTLDVVCHDDENIGI